MLTADRRRWLALAAWGVIAAVLLRIVSGGGSLVGVGYVLRHEPEIVVAVGGIVLVGAGVALVGLALRSSWAWRASSVGAVLAILAGLLLLAGGHDSAALVVVAALAILGLAWPRRSATGARPDRSAGEG